VPTLEWRNTPFDGYAANNQRVAPWDSSRRVVINWSRRWGGEESVGRSRTGRRRSRWPPSPGLPADGGGTKAWIGGDVSGGDPVGETVDVRA